MKSFIFNKKDYANYKDMYRDMAKKFGGDKIEEYYDTSTFDFDPNIVWEYLLCMFAYAKRDISIVCLNFDRENLKKPKNLDDYEYNIVFIVFERFVKEYPNNKLEFRMDEDIN